jgi:subtilisin
MYHRYGRSMAEGCGGTDQPTFVPPSRIQRSETTGRFIITFREDAVVAGMSLLNKEGGIGNLPNAKDFTESAIPAEAISAAGGAVFPTLGVAVVTMDNVGLNRITAAQNGNSSILAVEPERVRYALDSPSISTTYLTGYRDAINTLYEKLIGGDVEPEAIAAAGFVDDAQSTWGLKAARVVNSTYSGRGIKVAVLDTGMDLAHPDFIGRAIVHKSFVPGESVQDVNGHGTHCIGTACGSTDVNGRRYGVARDATIFVGKVLGNDGFGNDTWIIAAIEWAINNDCEVISMSLGAAVATPSPAYEAIGKRALDNDSLIVAAAGNEHPFSTVGQPANSPSILAVAAVDSALRTAPFSCRSGSALGANVDIAGPGVKVYSSVPMPERYDGSFSGTSMATPHVAGIAALWAESNRARGWELWQLVTSHARRLPQSSTEVGDGLVQAP